MNNDINFMICPVGGDADLCKVSLATAADVLGFYFRNSPTTEDQMGVFLKLPKLKCQENGSPIQSSLLLSDRQIIEHKLTRSEQVTSPWFQLLQVFIEVIVIHEGLSAGLLKETRLSSERLLQF